MAKVFWIMLPWIFGENGYQVVIDGARLGMILFAQLIFNCSQYSSIRLEY